MSVSATGGAGRPLPSAAHHRHDKRQDQEPAEFPALSNPDSAAQYLTADDRAQLQAKAGLEVTADGEVGTSASLSPNDTFAAFQLARKLAEERAQGTVTGTVSPHHLRDLATRYGFSPRALERFSDGGEEGLDVRA
ncbi:hypothetical protein SAMN06264364_1359 [Quadrisphaera granulorum]|uniref:Uncharacterized protein n=1 Tax=Quadrisphaera granulorum TaxID=317664 RepID=A0A315ZQA4_9ACTN|nr:hypothetical protein [Quadrisphaera granulorum]PWJ47706.1 hypothetical protein BXY45_1359 [Quadrisphaera granulorum]SZE98660.1 hypothetical protein SAMN06264364_1359 [Quadrisphaera granulorum]